MSEIKPSGSSVITTAASTPVNNTYPPYLFFWDMNQEDANFGATSPVSQIAAQYFGAASLSPNPSDSNISWLEIEAGNFPAAYWYNNTNANTWGETLGRGGVQFDWMYESSYTSGALLLQIGTKSQNPALDADDGIAVRAKTVGGGPGIGISNTAALDLAWISPAPQTKYTIIYRWDRRTSNPSGERTAILYLLQNDGAIRIVGWSPITLAAQPKGYVWHLLLPGNDTAISMAQWMKNFYVYDTWDYDLPVTAWQDFEVASLTTANLEASDHNASGSFTYVFSGSTSRFSIQSSAQKTNPSTINLWSDTGTNGLRNDLSVTAAGGIELTFSATPSARSFGFWLKTANLATGTSARVCYAGTTMQFEQRNTAGQQELYIRNNAGTLSSMINVSADTWYWVTILAVRNSTCRLQAFTEAGVQVGTEVTVTGSNNSIATIAFGSLASYTAQAAGVYHDIDNYVHDSSAYFPLKPWQ